MEHFSERLSARDRLFLDLEGPHAPQHIGAVCLFDAATLRGADGAIDVARIRALVASRLHQLPRTRQRLAWVPYEHHPVWVDDEHFVLEDHVRHTALPKPGNERQLKRQIGRLLAQPLDRDRPLWEIWVIEGLAGGERFAVLAKVHHCMADGVAGLEWMGALFSTTPDEQVEPPQPWSPRPAPDRDELLRREVGRRAEQWLGALQRLPSLLERRESLEDLLGRVTEGAAALAETLGAALAPAPETPLNRALGPQRRFDWRTLPLERGQALRKALGGTLNDIALACVTGGLRRFLALRHVETDGLVLRATIPVNLRSTDDSGATGNKLALYIVDLPVGVEDPRERFARACEAAAHAKASRQRYGEELLTAAAEWTTGALMSAAARAALLARPYNLVITNIPGPRQPLYLLGARLARLVPAVNLVEGQGLGVALASYAGELSFGFIADWDLVPDLHAFADAVIASFEELEQLATPRS